MKSLMDNTAARVLACVIVGALFVLAPIGAVFAYLFLAINGLEALGVRRDIAEIVSALGIPMVGLFFLLGDVVLKEQFPRQKEKPWATTRRSR